MKKLQLGIMAIASLTGVGIASTGFTVKHKFATITVYAVKNILTGTYSYTTTVPSGKSCSSASNEACTFTTTLTITRLNDNTQSPNYTSSFPAENTIGNPYVNYLTHTNKIYQ